MTGHLLSVARNQIQAHGVDAITQTGRRWTVGKHVSQMRITFGTDHFGADHAVTDIADFDHGTCANGLIKTRPAATGVEFSLRVEQGRIAADAVIDTIGFGAVVFARERSLGALEAAHVVLLGIEHRAPFFQGFLQLFHSPTSATEKA